MISHRSFGKRLLLAQAMGDQPHCDVSPRAKECTEADRFLAQWAEMASGVVWFRTPHIPTDTAHG